ncbi:MAG: hypothetical protein Q4F79_06545 [Eubacteriales bacterium]|nr:hypothetical protein [Eubacteriales bacterium]
MMGRQSGQMSMVILDITELIPENHLLRKINQMVSFDFIYNLLAPYYPANGRPSVDPVSMFKILPLQHQVRTPSCLGNPVKHCLSLVLWF